MKTPGYIAAAGGTVVAVGAYVWLRSKTAFEDSSGTVVPEGKPVALPPGTPPTLGAKAVEVALGLYRRGVAEDPKGSNRGPVVDEIVRGVHGDGEKLLGKAWCARFVRYAFDKAAKDAGLSPPFTGIKDPLAAVLSWRDTFKDYSTSTPKPGAVGLLINLPNRRHATLVVSVKGNGPKAVVTTVEGNHSDKVALVERPASDFAAFVDVDRYVAEHAGKPDDKKPLVSGLIGLDLLGAIG